MKTPEKLNGFPGIGYLDALMNASHIDRLSSPHSGKSTTTAERSNSIVMFFILFII